MRFAPLSETNFPYVNLVRLYRVSIGRSWALGPSLCKRLDLPVNPDGEERDL